MRSAAREGAPRRVVGVMSGTSCDGVDAVAALLSGDGEQGLTLRLAAHHSRPYDDALRQRLLRLGEARAPELARLHVELGRRFGEAVAAVVSAAGWRPEQVDVVGSPGHTAVHLPPDEEGAGATLSLGDGDVLAEVSGCPVFSDMRARDRAAGGHGAPLVAAADALVLRRPGRVRAALNLGGIANITVVPPAGPPLAFDTGPGNMLLDGALARASGGAHAFDEGGALGLAGRVAADWLEAALAEDAFLTRPPPRSTGRERYGAPFLDRHWAALGALSLPDLAATLAAYTVEAVARSLEEHVTSSPDELVVSGGGALNACLMGGLQTRLPGLAVRDSEEALGVGVFTREALAFAVLADASLGARPGNVPGVTGARRPVVLGKFSGGAQPWPLARPTLPEMDLGTGGRTWRPRRRQDRGQDRGAARSGRSDLAARGADGASSSGA